MRLFLYTVAAFCLVKSYSQNKPNVIIIITDDQGYQDLGCYGSPLIKTPAIDKMAKEGLRLTSYYVSSSVSSASRAGLMTGKFNNKNGITGVLWPGDEGLSTDEKTIAEYLKEAGYKTACFGKWHLGDAEGHLPINQGFDIYYGIPYSNDMYIGPTQKIDKNIKLREGFTIRKIKEAQNFVKSHNRQEISKKGLIGLSPLMSQNKVIEFPCDQSTLTHRYFDRAIDFISDIKGYPFFIYLTPNMPHIPLYASDQFKGTSKRGLYGDVIEEIDWNVGRLLSYLEENNLSENTIIVYTSDNGPWLEHKENGGSALPLKDGKFSHYEGGVRVPCIIKWENHIPQNITSEAIMVNVDWLPTILHYAGIETINKDIDGVDYSAFLSNPEINIRDEYPYIKNGAIHGIRKNNWIYLPKTGAKKTPANPKPELFNIQKDINEKYNLYEQNPQVVEEMKRLIKKYVFQ